MIFLQEMGGGGDGGSYLFSKVGDGEEGGSLVKVD